MSESQTKSTVSARVDTDKKADLIILADDRSTPFDKVKLSDLIREAVDDYVTKHQDEIPEYDRDQLEEVQKGAV